MENRLIEVLSCSETKNNNEMKVVRGYEEVISISFIYVGVSINNREVLKLPSEF